MREDMAKVIVERPRYGSRLRGARKGYGKTFRKTALEDQPKHERIEERSGGMKSFNEHLGPLRRYLLGQVGRPWNKVFSEICAHISRDSVVQDHVRDHVWDYVVVHVKLIDGVPYHASGYFIDTPISSYAWSRIPLLYVCPRTGLLRRARPLKPRAHPVTPPAVERLTLIPHEADCVFAMVNSRWLHIDLSPFPRNPSVRYVSGVLIPLQAADVLFDRKLQRHEALQIYGRAFVAREARPATRDEVRRFCTKGGSPDLV